MTRADFIVVTDLEVYYKTRRRTVHALTNVNLTAQEGEFITVVGRSGCGKSTLLRVLAGLLLPTSGEVLIDGEPIRGPHYYRGFIFQEPNLYPWLSVYEAVEFGLKARGVPEKERAERVEEMLRIVQLEDFRDEPPYRLSGGMQQRVAIARVLANDPGILLMDEPFGALDALTRDVMQEELRKIWQLTKKTIIFITHSVEEALYLGTRLMVMSPRPGTMVQDIPLRFHAMANEAKDARAVRKLPEFVGMREQVLESVLAEESS
ncbi:MAG: ABC transporter ATP-binding protein, partial [Anaerolineae bacterium]